MLETKIISAETDIFIEVNDLSIEKLVGLVHLDENYLTFAIYRKKTKTKFRGQEIFAILYDKFITLNLPFNGIRGKWGYESDNTTTLNEYILTLPLHDAIFKTWTGARAQERGFCQTKVIRMLSYSQPPPEYAPVEVIFFK